MQEGLAAGLSPEQVILGALERATAQGASQEQVYQLETALRQVPVTATVPAGTEVVDLTMA